MKAPPEAHPPLPAALAALTGQGVAAIDTPAAVIDLDAMERNLARMAAFARTHGVRLRPHAKMHKSAFLARLQMQAGAVGVCVQKTSEAEALAAAGVTDIYISNEVIDPAKLRRVAALAQRLQAAGGRLAHRGGQPGGHCPARGGRVETGSRG
jgi:D-serine deaminase-like pyridoxal phosphate-dependent protein